MSKILLHRIRFTLILVQQIVLMALLLSFYIGLARYVLLLYSYTFSIPLRQATCVASHTLNSELYVTIKRSHASLFSTCCFSLSFIEHTLSSVQQEYNSTHEAFEVCCNVEHYYQDHSRFLQDTKYYLKRKVHLNQIISSWINNN